MVLTIAHMSCGSEFGWGWDAARNKNHGSVHYEATMLAGGPCGLGRLMIRAGGLSGLGGSQNSRTVPL